MSYRVSVLAISTLLALVFSGRAEALEPHVRPHSIVGFTIGGGSARVGIDLNGSSDISTANQTGFGFGFRLGKMIRPDLAFTLEGNGWSRRYDSFLGQRLIPTTVTASVIGGALTYFPAESGFYLRGGLGLGTGTIVLNYRGLVLSKNKYGLGYLAAAGYEFRIGETIAVGPSFNVGGMYLGRATIGTAVVDFDLRYATVGVAVNWYAGKKKKPYRP